jgi:beta-glucosidase
MDRRQLIQTAAAVAATGGLAAPATAQGETLRFPAGFLWGASTSSYQVEGRGDRTANSIWDTFCRVPGKIKDRSNGDIACDQYHRFAEDIALMQRAGLKAHRFSISWPRVLPNGTGQPDPKGLDYYSRFTDALLKAGIEPWVCLFHWDLPQALQDRGGWSNRQIADWFAEYATLMAKRLGDRTTHWVTFNEPNVHAIIGHGLGQHAPGLTGRSAMFTAMHHQNLAHGSGVVALRAAGGGKFRIGTVVNISPVRPADGAAANMPAVRMWDAVWNRAYIDPIFHGRYPDLITADIASLVKPGDLEHIKQPLDFLGVNYYGPHFQQVDPTGLVGTNWGATPRTLKTNGLGWAIDPNGLPEVLADLREHYGNPPVYVTENGTIYHDVAGPDGRVSDPDRIAYLRDHIAACQRAIGAKANLHGYFVWSIIDNFEWAEGYTAPFGIVHVDRATLKRTPKASYDWYAHVAQTNSVST